MRGAVGPDPHIGAFRTVEGPIVARQLGGQWSADLCVPDKSNSAPLAHRHLVDEARYLLYSCLGCLTSHLCARGRCFANMGGMVAMMSTPVGKACVKSSGDMTLSSLGRRVSHSRIAAEGRRRGYLYFRRVSLCEVATLASGYIFEPHA